MQTLFSKKTRLWQLRQAKARTDVGLSADCGQR